jgi:hypothetical protein
LEHKGEGGHTLSVDVFPIANLIWKNYPEHFKTLSTFLIPNHSAGDKVQPDSLSFNSIPIPMKSSKSDITTMIDPFCPAILLQPKKSMLFTQLYVFGMIT